MRFSTLLVLPAAIVTGAFHTMVSASAIPYAAAGAYYSPSPSGISDNSAGLSIGEQTALHTSVPTVHFKLDENSLDDRSIAAGSKIDEQSLQHQARSGEALSIRDNAKVLQPRVNPMDYGYTAEQWHGWCVEAKERIEAHEILNYAANGNRPGFILAWKYVMEEIQRGRPVSLRTQAAPPYRANEDHPPAYSPGGRH
ncbi:hypothetical protein BC835DRAFT_132158 [Cytidiella melzeri]|nr:hypothetical protein BC835DRAFT_132158 [Cytidiella melzeri]